MKEIKDLINDTDIDEQEIPEDLFITGDKPEDLNNLKKGGSHAKKNNRSSAPFTEEGFEENFVVLLPSEV